MKFIGIDPGIGGGIASVSDGGTTATAMPKTERDVFDVIRLLSSGPCHAAIEKVHSMPKQGVASSFKFGMNYGYVRACLVSCKIPFSEVSPRTWMKSLGIRTRKKAETPTQWKNHLKQLAQNWFPQEHVTLATADALLIAEYCRRLQSQFQPTWERV